MTSSCCWCERAAITSFPPTKIKPVQVSGGGSQRTRVEGDLLHLSVVMITQLWSSRVITGSMFPPPPVTASRRCLTTPTSAPWTSCSGALSCETNTNQLFFNAKTRDNRNDPTLHSPQTAGSSGSGVSETAEGKELCSCAHLYLTRWAKAQQQIYEVDVYSSTR